MFRSNWGPIGQAVAPEQYEDIAKQYGDGGENGTTDVPLEQFKGGARLVYALRLGTGGTHGTYEIKDEKNESSDYFTLTKLKDSEEQLASIDQVEITGGADPIVNVNAYSKGFEVLEAYRWNVMAIDTEDTSIQMVMQLFLNRIYDSGKFTMGVIGEPTTVDFDTRLKHASAYNDYQMVYVGNVTGITEGINIFKAAQGSGILGDESRLRKASNIGGGALKGAGIGVAIGSVIPGAGTAIGAGIGAGAGALGAAIGGSNRSREIQLKDFSRRLYRKLWSTRGTQSRTFSPRPSQPSGTSFGMT